MEQLTEIIGDFAQGAGIVFALCAIIYTFFSLQALLGHRAKVRRLEREQETRRRARRTSLKWVHDNVKDLAHFLKHVPSMDPGHMTRVRRDLVRLEGMVLVSRHTFPEQVWEFVHRLDEAARIAADDVDRGTYVTWRAELEALLIYVWCLQGLKIGVNGGAARLRNDEIQMVASGMRWIIGRLEQDNLPLPFDRSYLKRDLEKYLQQIEHS